MNINIKDVIGERCITAEDGQKLHDLIEPEILKGNNVLLDFKGVIHYTAVFLCTAIGQLFKHPELREKLNELLPLNNITKEIASLIAIICTNANMYYTIPGYKKIIDTMIAKINMDKMSI